MFQNQFSQKSPRALHVLNHGWWRLAVGGWRLAVGNWRLVAVGGWWRLAVGGPLGRSLRAVLSKKKKTGPFRTALGTGTLNLMTAAGGGGGSPGERPRGVGQGLGGEAGEPTPRRLQGPVRHGVHQRGVAHAQFAKGPQDVHGGLDVEVRQGAGLQGPGGDRGHERRPAHPEPGEGPGELGEVVGVELVQRPLVQGPRGDGVHQRRLLHAEGREGLEGGRGCEGVVEGHPPVCDIPSGCCFFIGPWTVTRSFLRMLRRVAAFCRPLRPVYLPVLFPRSRSPVVWCAGAVLDVAGCAVCASAAPNNWRIGGCAGCCRGPSHPCVTFRLAPPPPPSTI